MKKLFNITKFKFGSKVYFLLFRNQKFYLVIFRLVEQGWSIFFREWNPHCSGWILTMAGLVLSDCSHALQLFFVAGVGAVPAAVLENAEKKNSITITSNTSRHLDRFKPIVWLTLLAKWKVKIGEVTREIADIKKTNAGRRDRKDTEKCWVIAYTYTQQQQEANCKTNNQPVSKLAS